MTVPPPEETSTDRLRCRRPAPDDIARYRALLLDPAVQRCLRPAPLTPFTPADAQDLLDGDRAHWSDHGYGPWVLEDRRTDAFVGRAGLCWTTATGSFAVELLWAIVPDRWGTGLATEAARAAIAVARAQRIEEVVSFTLPENIASRRVMEKAGLQPDGRIEHAGLEHVLYRLPGDPSVSPRPAAPGSPPR